MSTMSRDPTISCIMLPRSRRWITQTIRLFLNQDYEPKELIVFDDGPHPIGDLVLRDSQVRYIRIERALSPGAGRNFACSQARGEIIVHWEEGYWYAPDHLLYLLNGLMRSNADCCVVDPLSVYDLDSGKGWRIHGWLDSARPVPHGPLAYTRTFWQDGPFDETDEDEVGRFVRSVPNGQMAVLPEAACQVAVVWPSRIGIQKKSNARAYPGSKLHALLGRDSRFFGVQPGAPGQRQTRSRRPARESMGKLPASAASAILLARDPRLSALAIDYFLSQDYEPRELIVIDDTPESIEELAGGDPRIRCIRPDAGASAGAKRNLACSQTRGDIIVHWDETAWQAPGRMRYMVEALLQERADLCALSPSIWYDAGSGQAWQYHHPLDHGFRAGGGALCYRRKLWEKIPFPDTDVREDLRFVWNAPCRRAIALPPRDCHVTMALPGTRFDGPYWQAYPGDGVRRLLGSYCAAYEPELPPAPIPAHDVQPIMRDRQFAEEAATFDLKPAATPATVWTAAAERRPEPDRSPEALAHGELFVSCIMPTHNRRRFVPLAIDHFQRQDYEARELIIIDDGEDPIEDLVPADERIRYFRLNRRLSVGAKRNLACEQARGGIIVHWDDDDWQAPHRIRCQVETLLRENAELCGLNPVVFYDLTSGKGWLYQYPEGQFWVYGSTFCYRRELWERHRFADVDVGEDNQFIWNAPSARMVSVQDPECHISIIHEHNLSPKSPGGGNWRHYPVEGIQRAMSMDWGVYAELSTPRNAATADQLCVPENDQQPLTPVQADRFYSGYHWHLLEDRCRETARILVDAFEEAHSFLEAGCAKGFLVRCLRQAGKECWGFDQSRWALQHSDEATRPYVKLAGVDDYNFDRPFDMLLAFDLLAQLSEQQAFLFLSRARHWIRGCVLATIPCLDDASAASRGPDLNSATMRSRQWWHELLLRAGWRQDFLHRATEKGLQQHFNWARITSNVYLYAP